MEKVKEFFMNGYSCSESIVKAAIEKGLVDENLLPVASSFSGGMQQGCLCGAIAGSQIVIGALCGKNEKDQDGATAKLLAKQVIEKFKEEHKVTCCKILTKNFEMHSKERKQHCVAMVETCAKILNELLELDKVNIS